MRISGEVVIDAAEAERIAYIARIIISRDTRNHPLFADPLIKELKIDSIAKALGEAHAAFHSVKSSRFFVTKKIEPERWPRFFITLSKLLRMAAAHTSEARNICEVIFRPYRPRYVRTALPRLPLYIAINSLAAVISMIGRSRSEEGGSRDFYLIAKHLGECLQAYSSYCGWSLYVLAPEHAARRSKIKANRRNDQARAFAIEFAMEEYADEANRDKPLGVVAAEICEVIAVDPSPLGITASPCVETVKKWIDVVAPESSKRRGRPRKK
jgi:hypothetical protein